ncbi:unnamed protein product [Porites evermanni]|uniref:Uncharacterized protein n=1 Tax=Porites evermanni TaxID=104178 RepID=A0ABN8LEU3_9CNID|nr:unnamed protein product [Porites evermanni]
MEPYQHPYRSKEREDVCYQIAVNLSGLDHPKFKVNKRSIRDRQTLLITKHFEHFDHLHFLCLHGKLVVSKRALNTRIFPP